MDAKNQDFINRLAVILGNTSEMPLTEVTSWITLAYDLGHASGMKEGIDAIKSIREAA